ncbi:hypothetical protein HY250_01605 [Candidatus Azambacteria bacterium]|nr:hypothetical protein [Candidatus Azambacteria bacterium]MBI3685076.1 hypothetical protein [Candidatus Azambacteria bacterium]
MGEKIKEEYSREAFEKADEREKASEELGSEVYELGERLCKLYDYTNYPTTGHKGSIEDAWKNLYNEIINQGNLAGEKKIGLINLTEEEARTIEEECKKILTRVAEASKNLKTFEREKLGMHQEKEEGTEQEAVETEKE